MTKTLLATTTALVAFVAGAQAADLGAPRSAVAAAIVAPAFNWTGFYLGAFVGGTSTQSRVVELPVGIGYNGLGDAWSASKTGLALGGLAGYNWQINSVVLGVEADLGYRSSAVSGASTLVFDTFLRSRSGIQGSLRARFGVAADRGLIFATVGIAYADFGTRIFDTTPLTTITTTAQGLRAGWTVGAGIEYAVAANWTIRGEYLYADFGRSAVTGAVFIGGVDSGFPASWSVRNTTHTVRLGVNYLFSTGPR